MSREQPLGLHDKYYLVDGLPIRRRPGRKADNDIVLEWFVYPGEWVPISYSTIGHLVEALCDNEDRLYPPPRYQGGQMLLDALKQASLRGTDTVRWKS